jgi:hypothetical protein
MEDPRPRFKSGNFVKLQERGIISYLADVLLDPLFEQIDIQGAIIGMNADSPVESTYSVVEVLKKNAMKCVDILVDTIEKAIGEISVHITTGSNQEGDIFKGIEKIEEEEIVGVSVIPSRKLTLEPNGEEVFIQTMDIKWIPPDPERIRRLKKGRPDKKAE